MRDVGGRKLGAVVTIEDVSDIKALTEQLIRADRLAAMGELTAGVAHEVRNPLGIIRASVQLMEDAQCDAGRIHDAAEVIKQEIDRLDRVIKALLDFGRPSTPTLVHADINSVLEDVVLFTQRFAGQSDVKIVEHYAGPAGRHGRPRAAQAGVREPDQQRRAGDARGRYADDRDRSRDGSTSR